MDTGREMDTRKGFRRFSSCTSHTVLPEKLFWPVRRGLGEQGITFITEGEASNHIYNRRGSFLLFCDSFLLHYHIAAAFIKLVQAMSAGDTGEQVCV